jgi:hypothetical protein
MKTTNMKRSLPVAVLFIMGCSGDPASESNRTDEAAAPPPSMPVAAPESQPPPGTETAQQWHFTCPNGHTPGSDSAATCPVCGAELQHNQAFHAAPAGAGTGSGVPGQMQQVQAMPEPAQNSEGAWHYVCPKGHPGGAGEPMACATCGTALQHNDAYHANETQAIPVDPSQAGQAIQAQPGQPAPEPPQNAEGQWHYTCAKGHPGGAGAPGNCATCGEALVHNQAYHSQ